MSAIHADAPHLASSTGAWSTSAPVQPGIHPLCPPATDSMATALSAAVAHWPAVHETLTTHRATKVSALAAANGGTATIIGAAEATNVEQITGIEV